MTANRFFIPPQNIENDKCFLTEEEHIHFSKVLRGKVGEEISLTDGEGNLYKGEVISIGRKNTKVRIIERKKEEREIPPIIIAQSILKNETMDFVIQKGTELGADQIFPIFSKRSKLIKKENIETKLRHWNLIAINALKQSKRLYLPKIEIPKELEDFLKIPFGGEKLLFSENGNIPIKEILKSKPETAILLFGPEGGWEKEEEELILNHGFKSISLGKYILRSETAVISAMAVLSIFWRN